MTIREILDQHPHLEPELRTFYRVLPGLLTDRDAGKYVVVKGDKTSGTWDTYRDAMQHGLQLFGPGAFLVQRIDPRMMDLLAAEFGPQPAPEPTGCPA
jgi:hypothetical protein